ncbi:MAG TPA: hypothetical protein VN697_03385 [Tepidiformaceae bacterium]|nr:hypothetical protein [Tepidiformaceae bacterium]
MSSASTGGLACTTPRYQAWTDNTFTPLPQETFSTAGAGLDITDDPGDAATVISLPILVTPGSCTNCSATIDNFGRVTAYAPGTAGADALATYEVTSSSHIPVNGVNLGALASGVNEQVTTAGVAAPLTYQCVASEVQIGAASGGGLAQTSNLTYGVLGNGLVVGGAPQATFPAEIDAQAASGSSFIATHTAGIGSGDYSGFVIYLGATLAGAPYFQYLVPALANTTFGASGSAILDSNTSSSGQFRIGNSSTSNGIDLYTGSSRTTRVHLASAGDLDFVAMTAPATPASGIGALYVDSGSKNIAVKDDAGNINHGIRTNSCGASHFFTAVGGDGSSTCSTVAFSDVTGSATCAQLPALTGDTHSSAGSCATVTDHLTDGAGTSFSTSGVFVPGQPFVATAGNHIATNAIKNFGRTTSIFYSWNDFGLFTGISCWLTPGPTGAGTINPCQPDGFGVVAELAKGFAANFCRVTVNVVVNSYAAAAVPLTFQVTRNGSNVTGCVTSGLAAGFTGVIDSGEVSVSGSASTDTWGVLAAGSYPGGTSSLYVDVEIYQ